MPLKPDLKLISNLSPVAFQHPLDVQARQTLSNIPMLKTISTTISEWFTEGSLFNYHIANSIRVSSCQYPSLYSQFVKMARVLNLQKLPNLFITNEPNVNAYAVGQKNYLIAVSSRLIDLMTEDELLAVIGHELGHIKCEHMLYSSIAEILHLTGGMLFDSVLPVPLLGKILDTGALLALMEWYRKAELSCDRAALLATQNSQAVCSMLAKLAGYSHNLRDPINVEGVIQQAADYEDRESDSPIGQLIRLKVLIQQTHPYPVVRVKEINQWAESEQYKKLVGIAATSSLPVTEPKLSEHSSQDERFLPVGKF